MLGFQTQRERLLKAYKDQGAEIVCRTIPYHSTGVIEFDVVDYAGVAPGIAYAVARKNQTINFFSYGVGEQVNLGGTAGNVRATEAETNLGKGTSTNGAQDFVIEGVGMHCRGMRVQWAEDTGNTTGSGTPTDVDVVDMLAGNVACYDPAAINMPAQGQSPFNLENGMFQSILGLTSIEFQFDRKRVEKIGTIDVLPQAGAQSFLRANGVPSVENRYRIPEGYLWRRDGMPDSEFTANIVLQRPLVVTINGIIPYTGNSGTPGVPTNIYLEVVMRLYGLAVDLPSAN